MGDNGVKKQTPGKRLSTAPFGGDLKVSRACLGHPIELVALRGTPRKIPFANVTLANGDDMLKEKERQGRDKG
jgi:hypothetical protein